MWSFAFGTNREPLITDPLAAKMAEHTSPAHQRID